MTFFASFFGFEDREFVFEINGFYRRFMFFSNDKQLKAFIWAQNPEKIHLGAIYPQRSSGEEDGFWKTGAYRNISNRKWLLILILMIFLKREPVVLPKLCVVNAGFCYKIRWSSSTRFLQSISISRISSGSSLEEEVFIVISRIRQFKDGKVINAPILYIIWNSLKTSVWKL